MYISVRKNGKKVLYVRLNKVIYGLLSNALLFYWKLKKQLFNFGFIFNEYNSCVANKMVDRSQMTMNFHVDDLQISHRRPQRVT